jgi:predicted TIM-barrel fold metal-dependent hydrolase
MFDSHAHLVSGDLGRYPRLPGYDAAKPLEAERLVAEMDASGVGRALVVQRSQYYGFDNSLVCDAATAFPDRLAAVCSIDPMGANPAEQVRFWICERGAVGVRLMETQRGSGLSCLAGDGAEAVWRAARDLEIPLCVHFFGWNRTAGLEQLERQLRSYPGLRVVIDHLTNIAAETGPPDFGMDQPFRALADLPNVYMKFTTIPLGGMEAAEVETSPLIRRAADVFGAERLMWGSDITQSKGDYGAMAAMARRATASLTSPEQQAALSDSVWTVYGPAIRAHGDRRLISG